MKFTENIHLVVGPETIFVSVALNYRYSWYKSIEMGFSISIYWVSSLTWAILSWQPPPWQHAITTAPWQQRNILLGYGQCARQLKDWRAPSPVSCPTCCANTNDLIGMSMFIKDFGVHDVIWIFIQLCNVSVTWETLLLRGGMAPCRVIFHENVNFLFVVQKCQVIHAFHKTHKQNVFAVIEIHTSGNFIDNMVFGDQRVSTKKWRWWAAFSSVFWTIYPTNRKAIYIDI